MPATLSAVSALCQHTEHRRVAGGRERVVASHRLELQRLPSERCHTLLPAGEQAREGGKEGIIE